MFDRASSVVCSRSTSLRRDVTWLARVPAANRAMKSLSCAIFFSRCAFCDSMRERICVLAIDHVVVAAGVGDDRLVVDVGGMRADGVQEMPVVRDDDERALVADEKLAAASESSRGRGGWSARRAAAPAGWPNSACASSTRTFWPPWSSAIVPLVQRARECRGPAADGGVAFGRVAVFSPTIASSSPRRMPSSSVRSALCVQPVALLEGAPQARVAHDHRVDDAEGRRRTGPGAARRSCRAG